MKRSEKNRESAGKIYCSVHEHSINWEVDPLTWKLKLFHKKIHRIWVTSMLLWQRS